MTKGLGDAIENKKYEKKSNRVPNTRYSYLFQRTNLILIIQFAVEIRSEDMVWNKIVTLSDSSMRDSIGNILSAPSAISIIIITCKHARNFQ